MSTISQLDSGLIEWLAHGERGVSSNTMFTFITGVPANRDEYYGVPHDPGDLRRCRLLCEAGLFIQRDLDKMKAVSPQWCAIVEHWDELCALMDEESPNWRTPKRGERAPKTFELLQSLIK